MSKELEKLVGDRHLWRDVWMLRTEFDGEKRLRRLQVKEHVINLLKTVHHFSRLSIGYGARSLIDNPEKRQEGHFTLDSFLREYPSLLNEVGKSVSRQEITKGVKYFGVLGDYWGLKDAELILDRNIRPPGSTGLPDAERIQIERQYIYGDRTQVQEARVSLLHEAEIWQNLARYYNFDKKNTRLKINYHIKDFASFDRNARALGQIFIPMSLGRFKVPFIIFSPLLQVGSARYELEGSYDIQSVLGFEKDVNGSLRLLAVRKVNRVWDSESSRQVYAYARNKFSSQ